MASVIPLGLLLALQASDPDDSHWSVQLGTMFSVRTLGSEDPRIGKIFSIAYGRPEPRLRLGKYRPELVFEATVMPSSSRGYVDIAPDRTTSLGILAIARYRFTPWKGARTFLDLGWGMQYSTQATSDQPSQWNSTPSLGLGTEVDWGPKDGYVLARWFHSSNAGTKGNNPGWNQIWVVCGVKL